MTLKNLSFMGYPNYAVSKDGKVYSFLSQRFLKNSYNSTTKTVRVNLYGIDSKATTIEVHRLVARAFIPNPNNYLVVNHLDGDRTNNTVSNLEWCTHEHNSIHAVTTGLTPRGLTEETAHTIFKMMEDGYRNIDISEISGISYDVISKMRSGENYRGIWEQYNIPSKKHSVSISTVLKIKEMLADGHFVETIVKELKISRSIIKDIRDGKRFSNINLERATTIESTLI